MSAHTPTASIGYYGPDPKAEVGPAGDTYLNHERGILSWLFTLDHKRIALMYMVSVLSFFFLGGMFAMLLRTELLTPGPTFSSNPTKAWDFYNHMFTLHGSVMIFLFLVPAVPAILGNFVLPLMLGAKDVAFPRLNLASFWIYALGGVFFVWVLLGGVIKSAFPELNNMWIGHLLPFGLDTGWTFYTPYSTSKTTSGVIPATMGIFVLGFSSILTGVNFIASIHMLRPKGMTWFRMPLFLWALYATAIIQILATPVLAITVLLLLAERVIGLGIFDPTIGGDPILYQHFFWFYSHPAVYIMILPALGVISEIVGTFSRKHIFGYNFIAISSIAIALLGFLVWGHHMFVSGQSPLANAIFSLITFTTAIPSAVKVFNWLATMYKGQIRLLTPMLYVLGSILLFTVGGLTGLFLGSLSTDIHFHDTYFVVAHFHYVMMGAPLFAFVGGVYFWFPKMFGKMYNERVGQFASVLMFIGFNLTFFVQFIAGAHGMPRRYASYLPGFQPYHIVSTIGAYILGLSLFIVLYNWVAALINGPKAPANPWGSNTLEWRTTSPPPHDNFTTTPEAGDPYDMGRWEYNPSDKGWYLTPEAEAQEARGRSGRRMVADGGDPHKNVEPIPE